MNIYIHIAKCKDKHIQKYTMHIIYIYIYIYIFITAYKYLHINIHIHCFCLYQWKNKLISLYTYIYIYIYIINITGLCGHLWLCLSLYTAYMHIYQFIYKLLVYILVSTYTKYEYIILCVCYKHGNTFIDIYQSICQCVMWYVCVLISL